MKKIMDKSGIRGIDKVEEKLAYELSNCLWSILVLVDKCDFDVV